MCPGGLTALDELMREWMAIAPRRDEWKLEFGSTRLGLARAQRRPSFMLKKARHPGRAGSPAANQLRDRGCHQRPDLLGGCGVVSPTRVSHAEIFQIQRSGGGGGTEHPG